MEKIWEFFENLDEAVYVSDIDTYEIVYMNKFLRDMAGAEKGKYEGRKCYEILQGKKAPCMFCNNSKLKSGEYNSWNYRNEIFDKKFLVKDTLIEYEGKKLRFEFAIDIGNEKYKSGKNYSPKSDKIISECLKKVYSIHDEDEAINEILRYVGEEFQCDRVSVYVVRENKWIDTKYDWCIEGICPERGTLKNEPVENVLWCRNRLKNNEVIILDNVEDIRETFPSSYAMLKTKGVLSLIAIPLSFNKRIKGAIGLDNPDMTMTPSIIALLQVVKYIVETLLKRKSMIYKLKELSFCDKLTGALNRNSLSHYYSQSLMADSAGVIFCDISGLKKVNDTEGHTAGDRLIKQSYNLIKSVLNLEKIYRIGGDEFVALYENCTENEIKEKVHELKKAVSRRKNHIAVGYSWSDSYPIMIESLIAEADKDMYGDKKEYYSTRDFFAKIAENFSGKEYQILQTDRSSSFQRYLSKYYYDAEAMMKALTINNTAQFFYFGDVRENIFYISDYMKNRFGFDDNIVVNLPHEWEKRISLDEYKKANSRLVERLFEEKLDNFELLHQVEDVHGNRIWVHNSGIMQWNEDKTIPVFLAGRISCQDKDYAIDQITNFQTEHRALIRLQEIEKIGGTVVIGFALNEFDEINRSKGSHEANMLLYHIGSRMNCELSYKMTFYRLDGLYCLAIIEPEFADERLELMSEIERIVGEEYRNADIHISEPVSFALMQYPKKGLSSVEFIEEATKAIGKSKFIPNYIKENIKNTDEKIEDNIEDIRYQLEEAIRDNMRGFYIEIQPIVEKSLDENRVWGGEVLLRWNNNGINIPANLIISILEKTGRMIDVGKWVAEQTIKAASRIQKYRKDFHITFNVSHFQIQTDEFSEYLQKLLEEYRYNPEYLTIELTKVPFEGKARKISRFIDQCKSMGISVAMDDFGNSYSTFKLLVNFNVDILKFHIGTLDKIDDEKKEKFVKSMAYACHQFGCKICLEGVENNYMKDIFANIKWDFSQGYAYYRPMNMKDMYQLLM